MNSRWNAAIFCLILISLPYIILWWRSARARKRLMAAVERNAKKGQDEIAGHAVQYWLDMVNEHATEPLIAGPTSVLLYQGHEFLFVEGRISRLKVAFTSDYNRNTPLDVRKVYFLVAVGQSAVSILSARNNVFRRLAGTEDLAAFSVYRWSRFAQILNADQEASAR